MDVIENFLAQYNRQYDFYSELARLGSNQLEHELSKRGIKAIVSYRAKKPDRLKGKLVKRASEKNYQTVDDVFKDIVDLAGVRVALYFPSDRDLVDEIIKDVFKVDEVKTFPEKNHTPKINKRFSGYWASHYRVNVLSPNKNKIRYENTLFEIQVASVLMHAWAEVEHDLVYKPLSGGLSEEELAILDEINGLVLTGEIALERLQKAITNRAKESNDISDPYELTSLISNSLGKNYFKKLKLGDTKTLYNYLSNFDGLNTDKFSEYIKNVNQSEKETISDQLLNMIMSDSYSNIKNDKYLKKYFERSLGTTRDVSGFESFVKSWIVLEKGVSQINVEKNVHHRKYFTAKFEPLIDLNVVTRVEVNELNNFKRIRNNLLHGIETPAADELIVACHRLKELAIKIVNTIVDVSIKEQLLIELNHVAN